MRKEERPTESPAGRMDMVARSGMDAVLPVNGAANNTVAFNVMTCLYPLSGQYGFLPDLLCYISLLIAIFAGVFHGD